MLSSTSHSVHSPSRVRILSRLSESISTAAAEDGASNNAARRTLYRQFSIIAADAISIIHDGMPTIMTIVVAAPCPVTRMAVSNQEGRSLNSCTMELSPDYFRLRLILNPCYHFAAVPVVGGIHVMPERDIVRCTAAARAGILPNYIGTRNSGRNGDG